MAIDCPDPKCRESLVKAMNSACAELKERISKKVSISIMCWTFVAFLSAIGIVAGISYEAYSRSQDGKQAQLNSLRDKMGDCGKVTQELDKSMAVMQSDLNHIREQLDKQGLRQEQILEILNKIQRNQNNQD